jgi:5'-phosphate synthase pdxT subunit
MTSPTIGILALQGDYAAHAAMLEQLGAGVRLVRGAADLEDLAGLVIPGGESTTILRLLERNGLRDALVDYVAARPTFGTCAGVILLAREVTNPEQASLGILDVKVARNAFGRQVDSFIGVVASEPLGGTIEGVFIRAPRILDCGAGVEVLGRLAGGSEHGLPLEPVLVRQGHLLGATFHPELTADPRVHRFFVEEIVGRQGPS